MYLSYSFLQRKGPSNVSACLRWLLEIRVSTGWTESTHLHRSRHMGKVSLLFYSAKSTKQVCVCMSNFSYSLTLIDALDTLVVMGNHSEFRRVSNLLIETLDFDKDVNVSVFETNIRGLLKEWHDEKYLAIWIFRSIFTCTVAHVCNFSRRRTPVSSFVFKTSKSFAWTGMALFRSIASTSWESCIQAASRWETKHG